ncbi:MAG: glycosyltransferase family 2 protein [Saprospiraceae bacterium]
MPKLSYVIPCYYNEKNIPVTGATLIENESLFPAGTEFEYVLVDDGSKDGTWQALLDFQSQYPDRVKVIKLAGNVGSYFAMVAAMEHATGDCTVMISADLQDPPELIEKMFDYWQKGIKLVMANRTDREESFLQKVFSNTYHRMIQKFAIKNLPDGGFDFVLFDREIRERIVQMKEKNTNTLYLMLWMGYEYVSIPYTRRKREIGKSRWTIAKKVKLFIDSFIAFSFLPVRMISTTGIILGAGAFFYALFIIFEKLTGHIQVAGWSAMMIVFLFVSSFQMIALGIIGEYVWRTLDAARNRPLYVIDKISDLKK